MSLFIADLAFASSQSAFLDQAKIAILLVLLVASIGGFLLLRTSRAKQT
jgi:Na+/H+ antiporter NhaA